MSIRASLWSTSLLVCPVNQPEATRTISMSACHCAGAMLAFITAWIKKPADSCCSPPTAAATKPSGRPLLSTKSLANTSPLCSENLKRLVSGAPQSLVKKARTHFKCISTNGETSTLLLTLETGRTHQIRRHASQAGYPLIGDRRYGRRSCNAVLGG